eukprot:1146263-Pelagomonas_calceolata.AAC.1
MVHSWMSHTHTHRQPESMVANVSTALPRAGNIKDVRPHTIGQWGRPHALSLLLLFVVSGAPTG